MWIDKADTWRLAERLGGEALVDIVRDRTHTCYLGDRGQRHDWGYGCGTIALLAIFVQKATRPIGLYPRVDRR